MLRSQFGARSVVGALQIPFASSEFSALGTRLNPYSAKIYIFIINKRRKGLDKGQG